MTPLARTTDPLTSHEAAASIEPSVWIIQGQILLALRSFGPMAPEQIADRVGLPDAQVWKRCSDLKRDGLIVVHEAGGYKNRSGRRADVLAAA
jgi:biotin operon repressor